MHGTRYDQYKDAWDTSILAELKVGDRHETVRFFHCNKRSVDHPIFLEKVWGETGGRGHLNWLVMLIENKGGPWWCVTEAAASLILRKNYILMTKKKKKKMIFPNRITIPILTLVEYSLLL